METKGFQSLNKFPGSSNGMEPVEVIAPQFHVRRVGLKYLKSDNKNFVTSGHDRLRPTSRSFDPVNERSQVSSFAVGNRPGCLSQNAAQSFVALPASAAFLLPRALVFARNQSRPATTVSRIWKCFEINS